MSMRKTRTSRRVPAVPEKDQLARYLAAAAIAYRTGDSFDYAMRTYVSPEPQVGEFWKQCAELVEEGFRESFGASGAAERRGAGLIQ